jgi:hypothetical protein
MYFSKQVEARKCLMLSAVELVIAWFTISCPIFGSELQAITSSIIDQLS